MQSKPLIELIPYKRVIWIFGFAKTVSSTTLLTLGIGLLIDGVSNHLRWRGYNQTELLVGVVCVIIGIIIIILIDIWKTKQKKSELSTIDKKIEEMAEEVAEQKIIAVMERMKNANGKNKDY